MQKEYATLPVLWEHVLNFKKEMRGYLDEMKNDCFQRFEYVHGVGKLTEGDISTCDGNYGSQPPHQISMSRFLN